MLNETKRAMPVRGTEWDEEISRLCIAGARRLETRGVVLPGTVQFSYTETPVTDDRGNPVIDPDTGEQEIRVTVTDKSTLTDELCVRAIITYVKSMLGNPPNYEQLNDSFEEQMAELMMTDGYTEWHGEVIR